ncbi:MAG: hypothetical protein GPJ10_10375 [Microcystis aeruginosa L211-07]|nr:hypothetical protein [Microcystis aeruginosa L211-07]
MTNVISLDALKLHILIIQKTLNRLFLLPTASCGLLSVGASPAVRGLVGTSSALFSLAKNLNDILRFFKKLSLAEMNVYSIGERV